MADSGDSAYNKIHLERRISLFNGCAIIIGVIVGSGIFVGAKGVLMNSGSVGLSLIIWILSGAYATSGAFIYAELGTTIPKSGGEYAYITEAFGSLPAFLFLWAALVIINPISNAIMARTFAQYTLQPFVTCELPDEALSLLAACTICLLTFINCYSVKWSMRLQNIFSLAKMASLCVIIAAGLWWLIMGNTENLEPHALFEGTETDPSSIALAFYSGAFSFSGWNSLNFVTEELINPRKNLPRAIMLSLFTVTIIYMLVNISYFAVLSVDEILDSEAVAVSFAKVAMGKFAPVVPLFVAISCAGGLNSIIFSSSRMFFVGARNGQLPELLSMISVNYLTPLPSLLILAILSIMMLVTSNIYLLINYVTFTESFVTALSVAGLIKLRFTRPDIPRPIKHNILLPIIFLIFCVAILILPFFTQPEEFAIGASIIFIGIPFYFLFVYWENKPARLYKCWISTSQAIQKLLYCVPQEGHTD